MNRLPPESMASRAQWPNGLTGREFSTGRRVKPIPDSATRLTSTQVVIGALLVVLCAALILHWPEAGSVAP